MKMPDKVYVKKEKNNVIYSLSVQYDNGGEEYIRKDALIEWVNEKLQESVDRLDFHANRALAEIKDKLNSM